MKLSLDGAISVRLDDGWRKVGVAISWFLLDSSNAAFRVLSDMSLYC